MHAAGFLFGALAACSCSYLSRQSSRESSAIGKKRALSFLLLGLFLFAQAVNAWSWFSSTAAPLDSGFLSIF